MRVYSSVLILSALLLPGRLSAQENLVDNVEEKSESGNYANLYSVDKYSGSLQVNIPLYDYTSAGSGLSHSVSFGYDGTGVRVNSEASEVGLNWRLNTGGRITRKIMGFEDECTQGFRNTAVIPMPLLPGSHEALKADIGGVKRDAEIDVYEYTAGGHSGSFVIGKDGSVYQLEKSNVQITVLPFTLTGQVGSNAFEITLPNGIKYHFGLYNTIDMNVYKGVNTDECNLGPNEWYLSSSCY